MTGASDSTEASVGASRWTRRVIGPFTVRHILALGGVLGIGALILVLLAQPIARSSPGDLPTPGSGFYRLGEPTEGLAIGQVAPELGGHVERDSRDLDDLDGDPIRLAELRGRPVWLSFFATWCPPCQEETPVLRDAHARYSDEPRDGRGERPGRRPPRTYAAYAETYSLPYTIGFDGTSAIFHTYQGFGIPTHVFIDGDGVIRHLQYGPMDLGRCGRGRRALVGQPPTVVASPSSRSEAAASAPKRSHAELRGRAVRSRAELFARRAPMASTSCVYISKRRP